jgi:tellurite resistance protein
MGKLEVPEIPNVDRERLAAAVRKLVEQHARESAAPSVGPQSLSARLPALASLPPTDSDLQGGADAEATRHFLGLLEAAYLVAAPDGVTPAERAALGELIAQVTGQVRRDAVARALARFDEEIERDGLPARIAAVAARFEDFMAREEALTFAGIIALSDGSLSRRELRGLIEFAEQLGYSMGELQVALDTIASNLRRALAELPASSSA